MECESPHLRVSDLHAGGVDAVVELGLHAEAGLGACVADELDDGREGSQGSTAPVLRDVTEEAVLDLVGAPDTSVGQLA